MNKLSMSLLGMLLTSGLAAQGLPHQAFLDVNYVDGDEVGTGQAFRLQLPIKEGVYVVGARTETETDQNLELIQKEIGGGFYWNTDTGNRMYLGYSKVDFSIGASAEQELTKYSLGWRSRTSREMEWIVELNQTDFPEVNMDKEGYVAGLHYYFSDTFAVTAEARKWREQDVLFFGFRFTSGR